MRVKYQQGDVIITKLDDNDELGTTSQNDKVEQCTNKSAILAYGEVTGHMHQIKPVPDVLVTTITGQYKDEPHSFSIEGGSVVLTHEEHNPVELPAGKYKVRIVREFNHMTQRTGRVWD